VSRYGPRVFGRAPIAAGWCVLSAIPPIANSLGVSNEAEEVEFAVDSSLEGDGFEPSVPRQVFLAAPSIHAQFTFRNINRLARDRDRWFESISLQRRVVQTFGSSYRRAKADRLDTECSSGVLRWLWETGPL
jgi:hypothetical protein